MMHEKSIPVRGDTPERAILCMAGSGRSGTSLVASFLHKSGIMMGNDMRGPTHSNRLGYFEDMDFLDFHKGMLSRSGVDRYTPWLEFDISENDFRYGQELIEKRNKEHVHWGWKDPRATMFMDFWLKVEPDIRFLVMYRDPSEVMTSMYREQRRRIRYRHPTYAPRTWIVNNLQALNFSQRHPGSVAFLDLRTIKEKPREVIGELSAWMGVPLSVDVWNQVYKPSELRAVRQNRLKEPVISNLVRFAHSCYGSEMREVYKLLCASSLGKR
ncbi:sulfotransferase family protein [Thiohalobacter thiocyanaticus]|uniref:sulfotransferase family protein n=1 Tax=Thiohalobacter thiocyanaticus TaxID=585455 RepID=UPI000BBB1ADF|nr:sulfotransferase domain-containing protein [Thiohalobacter thiocyanaticus]